MTGKIIGIKQKEQCAIRASDGKRYYCNISEIVNMKNLSLNELAGLEVDFEPNGGGCEGSFYNK